MDVPMNNFKGVMLCNRPNENIMIMKEKYYITKNTGHFVLEYNHMINGDFVKNMKNQKLFNNKLIQY